MEHSAPSLSPPPPHSAHSHSYPPPTTSDSIMKGGDKTDGGRGHSVDGYDLDRADSRASTYATATEERDVPMDTGGSSSSNAVVRGASTTSPSTTGNGNNGNDDVDSDDNDDDDDNENNEPPPPPPTSAVSASTITPAAQLRLSLARRLMKGLSQLRFRSRFMLLFQGAFTLAQVGAFITMLALSANQDCVKPLRTFIALHVVRVALAYPVSFYNALAPPARPPRGEEDTPASRQRREARRVMGNPRLDRRLRTASDLLALFSLVWFFLGNVWLYSGGVCRDTSPYMWYSTLSILIIAYIRVAELVVIVLAVVFFLPIVILILRMFGGLEKKHEIGPLSKEEIAQLPAVYYIPKPESNDKPSTPEADVEKTGESSAVNVALPSSLSHPLPLSEQKPDVNMAEQASTTRPTRSSSSEEEPGNDSSKKPSQGNSTPSEPSATSKQHHRRHNILRLFFKRRRAGTHGADASSKSGAGAGGDGIYVALKHPLHPLPDNLSSCPICLSDYEAPPLRTAPEEERTKALEELEILTLLPCGHTIHKDCLAPWLQTSGRCPVCQRAVRGDEEKKQKKSRLRLGRRRQQARQTPQQSPERQDNNNEAPAPTGVRTQGAAAADIGHSARN